MHVLETTDYSFSDPTLAESDGFRFSRKCMIAYQSELEFCLHELELEHIIGSAGYMRLSGRMASIFPTLSRQAQKILCEAPKSLEYYTAHWDQICTGEKLEFAYSILSLAFGEKVAASALGYGARANVDSKFKTLDFDRYSHDVVFDGINESKIGGSLPAYEN